MGSVVPCCSALHVPDLPCESLCHKEGILRIGSVDAFIDTGMQAEELMSMLNHFTAQEALKIQAGVRGFLARKRLKQPGTAMPAQFMGLLLTMKKLGSIEQNLEPLVFPQAEEDPKLIDKDIVYLPDGSFYKGQWNELGQKHGKGLSIHPDGIQYEGDFAFGLAHGFGRLIKVSGEVYQGEFHDGSANGQGVCTKPNAFRYEGEWKNNQPHGHGQITESNGLMYVGEFRNGAKEGKGEFQWPDGSKYSGEVAQNNFHGIGEYCWASGPKYRGQWKQGKMHGQGVLERPGGEKFTGSFENDQKHGRGTVETTDGRVSIGQWCHGIKQGVFETRYSVEEDS